MDLEWNLLRSRNEPILEIIARKEVRNQVGLELKKPDGMELTTKGKDLEIIFAKIYL